MTKDWTYGAEHEWADWPYNAPLPRGYGRDRKDVTIVNSDGIANDPLGKLHDRGGEILTPPTFTPGGQVDCLLELRQLFPMARVNYRSNLHIHVRVPGLVEQLPLLKRIQRFIHAAMPLAFSVIQPLPRPELADFNLLEEYEGALRRWRRRRVSHQTLLTEERLRKQLSARTVKEFFELGVPWTKKNPRPMWHAQPRLCVNLAHLREPTDTVEFRHFAGTLDGSELLTAVEWCRDFLKAALYGINIGQLLEQYKDRPFPKFPPYIHWMEVRYRATVHNGSVPKEQIKENIRLIKEGKFVP